MSQTNGMSGAVESAPEVGMPEVDVSIQVALRVRNGSPAEGCRSLMRRISGFHTPQA